MSLKSTACLKCGKEEIIQISDMTAAYYKQKAVMFYLVTEEVEIRNYE
jgi:hypothetical protein